MTSSAPDAFGGWSDDVCWEVRVEPAGGGGFLTEVDVEQACRGVPDGAAVELVLLEMDNFSPAAVGVLARRLTGVQVRFTIGASARGAGGDFVSLFRQAQAHYLAAEARARRPARVTAASSQAPSALPVPADAEIAHLLQTVWDLLAGGEHWPTALRSTGAGCRL